MSTVLITQEDRRNIQHLKAASSPNLGDLGARVKLQQHYLSLQLFINITVIKYTTTTITALSKTHKTWAASAGLTGNLMK